MTACSAKRAPGSACPPPGWRASAVADFGDDRVPRASRRARRRARSGSAAHPARALDHTPLPAAHPRGTPPDDGLRARRSRVCSTRRSASRCSSPARRARVPPSSTRCSWKTARTGPLAAGSCCAPYRRPIRIPTPSRPTPASRSPTASCGCPPIVVDGLDAIHVYGGRQPKEDLSSMSFEFRSEEFTTRYNVPSYIDWLAHCDMRPAYDTHKLVLQILQRRFADVQWVLKSPVHMRSLPTLLAVYPDARIAVTHRDPLRILPSLTSLVAALRYAHSDAVDFADIGRYQSELWHGNLEQLVTLTDDGTLDPARVYHGQYADFLVEPLRAVRALYDHLGMTLTPEAERAMRDHLAAHPQGEHGAALVLVRRSRPRRHRGAREVRALPGAVRGAVGRLSACPRDEVLHTARVVVAVGAGARRRAPADRRRRQPRRARARRRDPRADGRRRRHRRARRRAGTGSRRDRARCRRACVRPTRPDGPLLTRRDDGMLQHLTNVGSGRLNPHAPLVEFIDLPAAPPPGTEPITVEVHARCTFTDTHAGSPARVHGGPVDERPRRSARHGRHRRRRERHDRGDHDPVPRRHARRRPCRSPCTRSRTARAARHGRPAR